MTTAYTSLLGLALPVQGELSGTWGDTVNNSITSLLDTAVAGTTTLSTDGDVTLSTTTGTSNQARQAVLLCSGARTALRTITAPAQSKIYTVINATTGGYSVKVVGVGPTTGVTIVAGESAQIAWNGSDFIRVSSNTTFDAITVTNLTDSGNLTFTGTGNRITGDFSNATQNNRVMFQSSTTNGNTNVEAIPNGTATVATLITNNSSDPLNGSIGYIQIQAAEFRVETTKRGTGTYLPMTFYTGGSERMRIDTSGNVGIGTSSPSSFGKFAVTAASGIIGNFESTQSATNANLLNLNATQTNSSAGIRLQVNSGTTAQGRIQLNGDSAIVFQQTSSDTERMRIDSSGNVLIGTTTSPAGSKELVLGGDYIEGVVAIGNSGTAKTIALTNGTVQTVTMTGNCTFTMPTAVAGKSFILIVSTGAGSFTGTFTSVKWPSNTAPTITTTASRWDILTFVSDGTNWYGTYAQAFQ